MIRYDEGGPELIERVEPLWLKLRGFHTALADRIARRLSERRFEQRADELRDHPRLHIQFAADPHGADVGCCVSAIRAEQRGEIELIWVDPEHRSAGIGANMMRRAIDWLRANDADWITLSVAPENPRAVALYERLGFVIDELRMALPPQR